MGNFKRRSRRSHFLMPLGRKLTASRSGIYDSCHTISLSKTLLSTSSPWTTLQIQWKVAAAIRTQCPGLPIERVQSDQGACCFALVFKVFPLSANGFLLFLYFNSTDASSHGML